MEFVSQGNPVLLEFQNSSVKTITLATLKNTTTDTVLTQTIPFECTDSSCSGSCSPGEVVKVWTAVFDPGHFNGTDVYEVLWEGTDVNDAPFSFNETGITITYVTDFYSGFLNVLRQSMLDDGQTCDYSPQTLLNAINYANCLINNRPPFTDCPPEKQPCNILLDLAKGHLYINRAGKEAGETFTYNDIGKSFSFDVSGKLLAIGENLQRNALQLLEQYKRNLRPALKGLQSRYARRSGRTARAFFMDRAIYRNFIR